MDIRRAIALALKYCTNRDYRDYRYIRKLHIFDPAYFFSQQEEQSPEDRDAGIDPLWLYFFITRQELSRAIETAGELRQLLDPHPLFDADFYVSTYLGPKNTRNPFAHYLREGWKHGWQPSRFFNPEWYAQNSQWDKSLGNPLDHFLRHGAASGISPSVFFDIGWYLDQTPALHKDVNSIFRHYKIHGAPAGKSPIPVFEPAGYLEQLGDENNSTIDDPLLDYLKNAEKGTSRPGRLFDPGYYRQRYLAENDTSLTLAHYLSAGVFAGAETDQRIAELPGKPLISIVVPVFNPAPYYLNNCIRSVIYQAYPYWELCLVDDCSADEQAREIIKNWAQKDKRIKYLFSEENKGISAATQAAAEMASGAFLGFLDHDDELTIDCLYCVARAINETGGEVFYSDEDLVGSDGSRLGVFFKPEFNLPLLYSHNYITHFVVVSAQLFRSVGGFSGELDGAQDYDLMLRLADTGSPVHSIPMVLYHWRAVETSTSIAHDQKPYAHLAGKNALEKSLRRKGIKADVTDTGIPYHYRLQCRQPLEPSVLVLCFADNAAGSEEELVEAIRNQTAYKNYSARILPDFVRAEPPSDPGDPGLLPTASGTGGAGKAAMINDAVLKCNADHVVLLGHGAEQLSAGWLNELVTSLSIDQRIGIVCGRVSYNGGDGRSYTVADLTDNAPSYYTAFLSSSSRHQNGLHNMQYVTCCDWQICLFSRAIFDCLNGFDALHFPNFMAMLDLCYRAADNRIKTLYTPYAMVSYEKDYAAFMNDGRSAVEEKRLFQSRHNDRLERFDPYFSLAMLQENGITEKQFQSWLSGSSG